jgi:hypothetical protein
MRSSTDTRALVLVKLIHTAVWAVIAASILALPLVALRGRLDWALALTVLVVAEVGVLLANRWRCPLTDVAARYTDDRIVGFDIYLPRWLAENNKNIFGVLFLLGELVVLWCWLR